MTDTTEPTNNSVPISSKDIPLEEDDLFHCKLLSIKVENRIFKVPRELLETYSGVFKDMFRLPMSDNGPADGESDSVPLVLEGIRKEDFRAFLSILSSFHYESVTQNNKTDRNIFIIARLPLYKSLRKEDWIGALRLAHMWNMVNMERRAIEVLELDAKLSMIERLKLANEFQITSWIRPAYRYLVTRDEELRADDVPWLGPDVVQNVAKAREERTKLFLLRFLSREVPLPSCPTCREATLKLDISACSPQARQPESVKWAFRCENSLSALHYRSPLFYTPGSTVSAPPSHFTLEQLADFIHKTSNDPVRSLMDKDVDMLINRYLPIS